MSQPGTSILLVDDDQEIRELLETYLSRVGFQVRAVADGGAFRQSLCAESADLVILDVMLPDEDGFSLCRWVREHQRFAQVPIIMLTASSDEADRVIGLELGADDYLGKPFSPRELVARVRALSPWGARVFGARQLFSIFFVFPLARGEGIWYTMSPFASKGGRFDP